MIKHGLWSDVVNRVGEWKERSAYQIPMSCLFPQKMATGAAIFFDGYIAQGALRVTVLELWDRHGEFVAQLCMSDSLKQNRWIKIEEFLKNPALLDFSF